MTAPDTKTYGNSGINFSYMRISDAYLMLAEVCAALGDEGSAKTYLAIVHNRAFPGNNDPNFENIYRIAALCIMQCLKNVLWNSVAKACVVLTLSAPVFFRKLPLKTER